MRKAVLLLLVFLSLSSAAFAEVIPDDEADNYETVYQSGTDFSGIEIDGDEYGTEVFGADMRLGAAEEYSGLFEYLEQQCLKHTEEIDVSSYRIPSKEIFAVYCKFATYNPQLLIRTKLKWSKTLTGKTKKIYPEYLFENADMDNDARERMSEKVAEYIGAASACDNTAEKLLLIHDEMVKQCRYDTDYADESYHAYGILCNNTAVCQGYSQAFYMIMKELGIETDFCISESINHVWNYVKTDGSWYHIDVTWDDPIVKNSAGQIVNRTTAYHDNFLVTDNSIIKSHSLKSTWETYLDALPDCVEDNFESGYIFNAPGAVTITYGGSGFAFQKSIGGRKTMFSSKQLQTEDLLVSDTIENSTFNTVYYYCVGKQSEDIRIYSASFDGGRMTGIKASNRLSLQKETLYKYNFPKAPDNSESFLYFWLSDSQVPYTAKKTV